VGSFAPNKYGLFDMNGNVYQWIKEDYDENGQGCLRGAAWADEEEESINLTSRWPANKDDKFKSYGFRCVLAPLE
jgi:formylglycine-generating enzyme required for sulfatase activity